MILALMVGAVGEEDEATGRVGEGLAREAYRGVSLVIYNFKTYYKKKSHSLATKNKSIDFPCYCRLRYYFNKKNLLYLVVN